jgi:hypothetical protein
VHAIGADHHPGVLLDGLSVSSMALDAHDDIVDARVTRRR